MTGVQTCALPISSLCRKAAAKKLSGDLRGQEVTVTDACTILQVSYFVAETAYQRAARSLGEERLADREAYRSAIFSARKEESRAIAASHNREAVRLAKYVFRQAQAVAQQARLSRQGPLALEALKDKQSREYAMEIARTNFEYFVGTLRDIGAVQK